MEEKLNKTIILALNEKIIDSDINGDFLIVLTDTGKVLYKNFMDVLDSWHLIAELEK